MENLGANGLGHPGIKFIWISSNGVQNGFSFKNRKHRENEPSLELEFGPQSNSEGGWVRCSSD